MSYGELKCKLVMAEDGRYTLRAVLGDGEMQVVAAGRVTLPDGHMGGKPSLMLDRHLWEIAVRLDLQERLQHEWLFKRAGSAIDPNAVVEEGLSIENNLIDVVCDAYVPVILRARAGRDPFEHEPHAPAESWFSRARELSFNDWVRAVEEEAVSKGVIPPGLIAAIADADARLSSDWFGSWVEASRWLGVMEGETVIDVMRRMWAAARRQSDESSSEG